MNLRRSRKRGIPVLPGSVSALVFLAFLLSFLGAIDSAPKRTTARPKKVGTLQPIGGEKDSSEERELATTNRRSSQQKTSAPKPLIIREQDSAGEGGPELTGTVDPIGARCAILVGGCRLELEFQNRTNSWVNGIDLRYQLSRAGRVIKEGYINGTSELLAPSGNRTVSQRVDDISLDEYELHFCVVLFTWFTDGSAMYGQVVRSDVCLSKVIHAEG